MKWRFNVNQRLSAYTVAVKCIVLGALLVLLSTPGALSQQTGQPSYTHDAEGLQKQIDAGLQALEKGRLADVDKQFRGFLVPNAEEWFSRYFPQDRAQELAKRQSQAADDWKTSLTALMTLYPKGTQFHARCAPDQTQSTRESQIVAGSILPTSPPPIETYVLEFSANKPSALSIQRVAYVAVFVFSDGAYRFVGGPDGPFWSAPQKKRNTEP